MSPLPHLFSYIFHFLSNVQFTTTETLAEYMGFNQARSSDGSRVNNQVAINVDRIGVKIVILSMQWASIRSIINPKLPGNTASFDYYLIEIAVLYCSLGLELALIEENIHVGKRERERKSRATDDDDEPSTGRCYVPAEERRKITCERVVTSSANASSAVGDRLF